MKIGPRHGQQAFSAQHLLSSHQLRPAGQTQPWKEQTDKVVGNILNIRHFAARNRNKGMIFVIFSSRPEKLLYIADV
jgi:hypothetical protein